MGSGLGLCSAQLPLNRPAWGMFTKASHLTEAQATLKAGCARLVSKGCGDKPSGRPSCEAQVSKDRMCLGKYDCRQRGLILQGAPWWKHARLSTRMVRGGKGTAQLVCGEVGRQGPQRDLWSRLAVVGLPGDGVEAGTQGHAMGLPA